MNRIQVIDQLQCKPRQFDEAIEALGMSGSDYTEAQVGEILDYLSNPSSPASNGQAVGVGAIPHRDTTAGVELLGADTGRAVMEGLTRAVQHHLGVAATESAAHGWISHYERYGEHHPDLTDQPQYQAVIEKVVYEKNAARPALAFFDPGTGFQVSAPSVPEMLASYETLRKVGPARLTAASPALLPGA